MARHDPKVLNVRIEDLVDDRFVRKLDESGVIDRLSSDRTSFVARRGQSNFAVERTAGSHSLAAAAHRGVRWLSPTTLASGLQQARDVTE
jgi:hypothetical protein